MPTIICPNCNKRLGVEKKSRDFCSYCKTAFTVRKDLSLKRVRSEGRTENKNRAYLMPMWLKIMTGAIAVLFTIFGLPIFEILASQYEDGTVYYMLGFINIRQIPFSISNIITNIVFLIIGLFSFFLLLGKKWAIYPTIGLTISFIGLSMYVTLMSLVQFGMAFPIELPFAIAGIVGLANLVPLWMFEYE